VSIVGSGGLIGYFGRVSSVSLDRTFVTVPGELYDYISKYPGVRVMVSSYRVHGVYCFVTDKGRAVKDGIPSLVFPWPESVKRLQQRRYLRLKERLTVDYRIESEPAGLPTKTILPDEGRLWTQDISAGGVCLYAPASVAEGVVLALNIGFQGTTPIAVTATVVNVRPSGDGFALGLRFEKIDPRDRGYIEHYVRLNTLE